MIIEQLYTCCLSQGAYYIESNGEVAIIDPLREVGSYIKKADDAGGKIKYIFETHFHADFVSGHVTLADRTDAKIIYGPNADPTFDCIIATDGQEFTVGDLTIIVMHTPGHTMESTTYLLRDADGKDHAIFTGDTLFLGDVGRPDLSQKSDDMTMQDLAGILYDSLRNKIMPLSDDVIVYPAHGAGSACGKNMMKETVDTLGNQKQMNYALRADMTREEFIKEVTDGLGAPPAYFPANVKLNKSGYSDIEEVIHNSLVALSPSDFIATAKEKEALVLDVRTQDDFAAGHVPSSIFIGLNGSFAPWVGELIVDVYQPILLVVNAGQEKEAITRLSRVGFDNVIGYLEGGIGAWKNGGQEIDTVESVDPNQLESMYADICENIYDVRRPGEYTASHISKAKHTSLGNINEHLVDFPKEENFYIHCAGGYRSMIAASILKSRGIHNLVNVTKGYDVIKNTSIPLDVACEASLS